MAEAARKIEETGQEGSGFQRWMRGLPRNLVEEILRQDPGKVAFHVKQPTHVVCTIVKATGESGLGIAICSHLERTMFDVREGKIKAAGRALRALKRRESGLPIRTSLAQFPSGWTPAQKKLVATIGFNLGWKSIYVDPMR